MLDKSNELQIESFKNALKEQRALYLADQALPVEQQMEDEQVGEIVTAVKQAVRNSLNLLMPETAEEEKNGMVSEYMSCFMDTSINEAFFLDLFNLDKEVRDFALQTYKNPGNSEEAKDEPGLDVSPLQGLSNTGSAYQAAQQALKKFHYNPNDFTPGHSGRQPTQKEVQLCSIASETAAYLSNEENLQRIYAYGDQTHRTLEEERRANPQASSLKRRPPGSVGVVDEDTLVVAENMARETGGKIPLVLNLANAYGAGGGWKHGAGAQEEELCRRSTIFLFFIEGLRFDGRHYTPEMSEIINGQSEFAYIIAGEQAIFREKGSYRFLGFGEVFKYRVMVLAALNLSFEGCARLSFEQILKHHRLTRETYQAEVEKRTEVAFKTAIATGDLWPILGALGCGAFLNDPGITSAIFFEKIKKYYGCFDLTDFGNLVNGNKNHPNFKFFSEQLKTFEQWRHTYEAAKVAAENIKHWHVDGAVDRSYERYKAWSKENGLTPVAFNEKPTQEMIDSLQLHNTNTVIEALSAQKIFQLVAGEALVKRWDERGEPCGNTPIQIDDVLLNLPPHVQDEVRNQLALISQIVSNLKEKESDLDIASQVEQLSLVLETLRAVQASVHAAQEEKKVPEGSRCHLKIIEGLEKLLESLKTHQLKLNEAAAIAASLEESRQKELFEKLQNMVTTLSNINPDGGSPALAEIESLPPKAKVRIQRLLGEITTEMTALLDTDSTNPADYFRALEAAFVPLSHLYQLFHTYDKVLPQEKAQIEKNLAELLTLQPKENRRLPRSPDGKIVVPPLGKSKVEKYSEPLDPSVAVSASVVNDELPETKGEKSGTPAIFDYSVSFKESRQGKTYITITFQSGMDIEKEVALLQSNQTKIEILTQNILTLTKRNSQEIEIQVKTAEDPEVLRALMAGYETSTLCEAGSKKLSTEIERLNKNPDEFAGLGVGNAAPPAGAREAAGDSSPRSAGDVGRYKLSGLSPRVGFSQAAKSSSVSSSSSSSAPTKDEQSNNNAERSLNR